MWPEYNWCSDVCQLRHTSWKSSEWYSRNLNVMLTQRPTLPTTLQQRTQCCRCRRVQWIHPTNQTYTLQLWGVYSGVINLLPPSLFRRARGPHVLLRGGGPWYYFCGTERVSIPVFLLLWEGRTAWCWSLQVGAKLRGHVMCLGPRIALIWPLGHGNCIKDIQ